ncbi:hypothetical protein D3C76_1026560 [compost metagenome]
MKTVSHRLRRIMRDAEGLDRQTVNFHHTARIQNPALLRLQNTHTLVELLPGRLIGVHRQLIFTGQCAQSLNMIRMLMGDEYRA